MSEIVKKIEQASINALTNILKLLMKEEDRRKKLPECERCGTELILEHTENKGTIVKFSAKGQEIFRNATMPFVWLYCRCPKCGWSLCTSDWEERTR